MSLQDDESVGGTAAEFQSHAGGRGRAGRRGTASAHSAAGVSAPAGVVFATFCAPGAAWYDRADSPLVDVSATLTYGPAF